MTFLCAFQENLQARGVSVDTAFQVATILIVFSTVLLAVRCELESVELEGFGAFLEATKYPLVEKGVRVVSGKNLDSMGADSNGAGKTTLVMAPL